MPESRSFRLNFNDQVHMQLGWCSRNDAEIYLGIVTKAVQEGKVTIEEKVPESWVEVKQIHGMDDEPQAL